VRTSKVSFRTGISPPFAGILLKILERSTHLILARDTAPPTVCGYITVLSDRVACGYISSLEVRPAYRNNGIGSELVRRMVGEINVDGGVYLTCAPALAPFYEKLGFTKCTGMVTRKRAV
jgi:ribosomal protein S18 acetylase RimI-like enzyme